ncbi:hypothetical protein GLAREA_12914 [Glarea lozoyensis ATCC 20868]|uniref:RNA-binding, RBD n=1 Tax=Glarea lozoyensis (strain ATCC 20868 / MF5171) TaxID=1116229 RepID=S3DDX4_GLAL2|nr:uncharacterized protein GLAREA_12914 [Glarea lozoyensis ATCC 20868]EPE30191.1 hypothetical protein GLAREA_12914 [Glarea lozoyensis ATCC 20868]
MLRALVCRVDLLTIYPTIRAQFHTSGVDYTTPLNVATVTIPKTDHDSLLISARQYANLRRNLFRGGIAEETLAVLIKDDTPLAENEANATSLQADSLTGVGLNSHSLPTNGGQDYTYGRNANYTPRNSDLRQQNTNGFQGQFQTNDDFSYMPDGPDGFYDEGSGNHDSQSKTQTQRQQYDKFAKRTVQLANLHEMTTHADIVDVVRGGMLLDIYLRSHDRTASISFLEEAHAQDFFRHVKRHDLYVRGKRVEIRWNDRQFILPGHVANKITIGATRNLVIQNRTPKHTEELIRDHLEHIHNLIVIKIGFRDQNVHISTNSVHNAMFARTCLMSRAIYKGSKIEWDEDECAAPLERPQQFQRENTVPKKKKEAPRMNRFQLLHTDDDEDPVDEEGEHDTHGISIPLPMPNFTGIAA